jgi:hypothetical protein
MEEGRGEQKMILKEEHSWRYSSPDFGLME